MMKPEHSSFPLSLMGEGARGRGRALVVAFAALIWLSGARTAYAKTPGYILTGGDLGDYAAQIYIDYAVELPNEHAVPTVRPAATPGSAYLLYSYWPFMAAQQLATRQPAATYYPESGLTFAGAEWLQLDSAAQQSLNAAIAEAKIRARRGELQNSVVYAGLELYFAEASFVITGGDASPATARAMPLHELAAVLEQAPVPNAGEQPGRGTAITVYATPRNAGQIVFFLYQPPRGDLPGLLWPSDTAASHHWLTTADFDRAFAAVPRVALLPGETAVETPGLSPSVATAVPPEAAELQHSSSSGRGSGLPLLAIATIVFSLLAIAGAAGARGLRRRRP